MKDAKTLAQEDAMPRRAYSYSRFSSSKQAAGDSERRQTEWPAVVSNEQGWTLDDTLVFIDRGRSGFHGKNRKPTSALTHFLELVKRGRITQGSILIIENIDRLSRQDVDTAHDLFRSIIRAGVWICTRTPFRIYKGDKDASFMDLLEPIWIMYCAHMESLKKSQRAAGAWEAVRRRARETKESHHRPPCWLRCVGHGFEVDPAKLALVQRVAQLSREGMGAGEIACLMTSEGQPNLGRNRQWSRYSIRGVLRSRNLIGEYQPRRLVDGRMVPDGPPITGYYPPALTEEQFIQTQAALDGRKRTRGRHAHYSVNLFTGLVRDAVSRGTLGLCHDARSGARYLVVTRCRALRIPYKGFEQAVLEALVALRPEDVLDPALRLDAREIRIAELTARILALGHRQAELQVALADPKRDGSAILPVLDRVSDDLKASAQERDRLQLETRSGRAEALTETQTLWGMRQQVAGDERVALDRRIRAALPAVVSEIWVQGQELGKQKRIVHIQIYLRSGARLDAVSLPAPLSRHETLAPLMTGVVVWDLAGHDLRHGPYRQCEPQHRAARPRKKKRPL